MIFVASHDTDRLVRVQPGKQANPQLRTTFFECVPDTCQRPTANSACWPTVVHGHTRHMTVGEYAETPLQDPGGAWRHGTVFLLRKAPPFTESVSVDGWTTTVVGGVRAVITRGPLQARKFDATFDTALEMANKGLDLMCVQGLADCAIREASEDRLADASAIYEGDGDCDRCRWECGALAATADTDDSRYVQIHQDVPHVG